MIYVGLRVACRLGHSGVRSRDRQLGFVTTQLVLTALSSITGCSGWFIS